MKLELYRKYRKPGYSIGLLYINGKFICNTLEDTDRGLKSGMSEAAIAAVKVKGKTAIPTGFSGIRIHSGNTAEDTEGCILCGKNTEVGKVTNSRFWTEKVYEYIRQGIKEGVIIDIHR